MTDARFGEEHYTAVLQINFRKVGQTCRFAATTSADFRKFATFFRERILLLD